jgi:alkanesulfonate monooxygenase SsuD/methylene tetrahydromethanopterin reductase-like flavin-dependent oxidoreductase (luciferase family)
MYPRGRRRRTAPARRALIGDLLARTERLRFFPDVANLPLRPPAMLATLAASLDVMSSGRFELGLGAGAFWDAVAAMGRPRRSPGESVDARPAPAHSIGIWLGAIKPRMLNLTGRAADGWVPSLPSVPPADVPEALERIGEGAAQAGRDPAAIRRIYNVSGAIVDGPARGVLHGPPAHWIEALTSFAELGFDTFVFWPDGEVLPQVERFAQEVAPGVREAVTPAVVR